MTGDGWIRMVSDRAKRLEQKSQSVERSLNEIDTVAVQFTPDVDVFRQIVSIRAGANVWYSYGIDQTPQGYAVTYLENISRPAMSRSKVPGQMVPLFDPMDQQLTTRALQAYLQAAGLTLGGRFSWDYRRSIDPATGQPRADLDELQAAQIRAVQRLDTTGRGVLRDVSMRQVALEMMRELESCAPAPTVIGGAS